MASRRSSGNFDFGSGHPATYTAVRRGRGGWASRLAALLVLLAGGAAALVYLQPQLVARWIEGTPLADLPYAPQRQPALFYKWRDARGDWQMTDAPPPAGTPHETLRVFPGQNVIPLPPKLQPGD